MKRRRVSKLGLKYMASTLFPAILVLVIASVICYNTISQSRVSTITQEVQRQATAKNLDAYNSLDKVIAEVNLLSKYSIMYNFMVTDSADDHYFSQTKATLALNEFSEFDRSIIVSSWVAVFDKGLFKSDGKCNYKRENITDFSVFPWYNVNKLNLGEIYYSKSYITDVNKAEANDRVISAICPVFDKTTHVLIGAYGVDISMRYINTLYVLEGYSTAVLFITDENGELLYFSDGVTSKRYEFAETFIKSTNLLNRDQVEFRSNLYRCVKVHAADKGWNLLYMIDNDRITSSVNSIAMPILVTFLIASVGLTIIMSIFIIRFVERIKLVTASTKDIASGKYDNRMVVDSDDEFGELALAFNETIDKLKSVAEFDEITKVYNITTFYRIAEDMIKSNDEMTGRYAIVRLDIDHFRLINDLYSWQTGNNILIHIANCIKNNIADKGICGRISGDIFVMCVKHKDKYELESILLDIKNEIMKYDIMIELNPHFGIYQEAEKDIPVYLMCDRAGVALSVIKGNLLNTFSYYDNAIGRKNTDIKFIEANMHSAIEQNQFFILLQPKFDMFDNKIVGAESLVRWEHPEKGLIRPDLFVPIFEKNGFVISLDEYVWEETCKNIHNWLEAGYDVVPISVNVSRIHIYDKHFLDTITGLVKKYNIPANLLELEFTESALLDDVAELYSLMEQLKENGFKLLMDDFASGYSSLNTLKSASFDIVKLDRDFINSICKSDRDRLLVTSTVALINSQNMEIVVEGVETEEQVNALKKAGCRIAQGYYYSRPINVSEFEKVAYKKED